MYTEKELDILVIGLTRADFQERIKAAIALREYLERNPPPSIDEIKKITVTIGDQVTDYQCVRGILELLQRLFMWSLEKGEVMSMEYLDNVENLCHKPFECRTAFLDFIIFLEKFVDCESPEYVDAIKTLTRLDAKIIRNASKNRKKERNRQGKKSLEWSDEEDEEKSEENGDSEDSSVTQIPRICLFDFNFLPRLVYKLFYGEKDPRNIIKLFNLVERLAEYIPANLSELFDLAILYFPIKFKQPKNDPHKITVGDLKDCIFRALVSIIDHADTMQQDCILETFKNKIDQIPGQYRIQMTSDVLKIYRLCLLRSPKHKDKIGADCLSFMISPSPEIRELALSIFIESVGSDDGDSSFSIILFIFITGLIAHPPPEIPCTDIIRRLLDHLCETRPFNNINYMLMDILNINWKASPRSVMMAIEAIDTICSFDMRYALLSLDKIYEAFYYGFSMFTNSRATSTRILQLASKYADVLLQYYQSEGNPNHHYVDIDGMGTHSQNAMIDSIVSGIEAQIHPGPNYNGRSKPGLSPIMNPTPKHTSSNHSGIDDLGNMYDNGNNDLTSDSNSDSRDTLSDESELFVLPSSETYGDLYTASSNLDSDDDDLYAANASAARVAVTPEITTSVTATAAFAVTANACGTPKMRSTAAVMVTANAIAAVSSGKTEKGSENATKNLIKMFGEIIRVNETRKNSKKQSEEIKKALTSEKLRAIENNFIAVEWKIIALISRWEIDSHDADYIVRFFMIRQRVGILFKAHVYNIPLIYYHPSWFQTPFLKNPGITWSVIKEITPRRPGRANDDQKKAWPIEKYNSSIIGLAVANWKRILKSLLHFNTSLATSIFEFLFGMAASLNRCMLLQTIGVDLFGYYVVQAYHIRHEDILDLCSVGICLGMMRSIYRRKVTKALIVLRWVTKITGMWKTKERFPELHCAGSILSNLALVNHSLDRVVYETWIGLANGIIIASRDMTPNEIDKWVVPHMAIFDRWTSRWASYSLSYRLDLINTTIHYGAGTLSAINLVNNQIVTPIPVMVEASNEIIPSLTMVAASTYIRRGYIYRSQTDISQQIQLLVERYLKEVIPCKKSKSCMLRVASRIRCNSPTCRPPGYAHNRYEDMDCVPCEMKLREREISYQLFILSLTKSGEYICECDFSPQDLFRLGLAVDEANLEAFYLHSDTKFKLLEVWTLLHPFLLKKYPDRVDTIEQMTVCLLDMIFGEKSALLPGPSISLDKITSPMLVALVYSFGIKRYSNLSTYIKSVTPIQQQNQINSSIDNKYSDLVKSVFKILVSSDIHCVGIREIINYELDYSNPSDPRFIMKDTGKTPSMSFSRDAPDSETTETNDDQVQVHTQAMIGIDKNINLSPGDNDKSNITGSDQDEKSTSKKDTPKTSTSTESLSIMMIKSLVSQSLLNTLCSSQIELPEDLMKLKKCVTNEASLTKLLKESSLPDFISRSEKTRDERNPEVEKDVSSIASEFSSYHMMYIDHIFTTVRSSVEMGKWLKGMALMYARNEKNKNIRAGYLEFYNAFVKIEQKHAKLAAEKQT